MKAIILAGGGGTRLWPVSRRQNPKQVKAIVGRKTLLRATYDRLRRGFKPSDIYIATAETQRSLVEAQLPRLPKGRLLLEPCRRDTASAIGYALLQVARQRPDETFVVINSDAYVNDVDEYLRVIRLADEFVRARPERTALIGITPAYPETGYGYIKTGRLLRRLSAQRGGDHVFEVERFVEKPTPAKAREYLAAGGYLWNPTLIVGRADRFLELYGEHLPEHAAVFAAMRRAFGRPDEPVRLRRLFRRLPSVSIDYGILEKAAGLAVIPAEFGWADVGHWRAVREIVSAGREQNVVKGKHVGVDSCGNLIYSYTGKLVATAGLTDMIVIDTEDALLICPQERAQDVKKIVSELERDQLAEYL